MILKYLSAFLMIYLDFNATTPLAPEAKAAIIDAMVGSFISFLAFKIKANKIFLVVSKTRTSTATLQAATL